MHSCPFCMGTPERKEAGIIVFFVYLYIHILYQKAPHWYMHTSWVRAFVLRNGTTVAISQNPMFQGQSSEWTTLSRSSVWGAWGGVKVEILKRYFFGGNMNMNLLVPCTVFFWHTKKRLRTIKNCQQHLVSPLCLKNNIRFFEQICSKNPTKNLGNLPGSSKGRWMEDKGCLYTIL